MKKVINVSVLVALIPMMVIGGGIYWAVKKNARFETYQKVKGQIIALTKKKEMFDKDQNVVYYPRIRYYAGGREHEAQLKTGSSHPLGRVGEKVDLLVNPENPQDIVVDSFMRKWFGPMTVCIIGFIILAFVVIGRVRVALSEDKRRKEYP